MAIPGLVPKFEVRSKVRIGIKKTLAGGKEIPASVDYFVFDAEADQPERLKELRIYLPHRLAEDNFSTGLEWWQGKLLACYSKGEVSADGRPYALRMETMEKGGRTLNLLEGAEVLSDEVIGRNRRKIVCPVRDCPILKRGDCKPMGRLLFWIDGVDRKPGVFQLDTKGWHSIENLEATLGQHADLRNVPFLLRVSFTQQGTSRFPELYLEEAVEINNEADITLAERLLLLDKEVRAVEEGMGAIVTVKSRLAELLDLTNPGWKQDEVVINWVKEKGAVEASKSLLNRHLS